MAREIDSDALRAYRDLIQAQLDTLEDVLIPQLRKNGDLGRMPAFGQMDGSDTARANYTAFHEGTWNNLQAIRESLNGIITTLNDSGDLSDESDDVTAASFDSELE